MTLEEALKKSETENVRISLKTDDVSGEFILVCGAITTEELYGRFVEGPAHLMRDGRVMRYRRQIGTFDENIVVLE